MKSNLIRIYKHNDHEIKINKTVNVELVLITLFVIPPLMALTIALLNFLNENM